MADITRSRAFPSTPNWRPIAVALVIIALVVVAALAYVGSQPRRVPPPFGPAANGLMTYETGGDIYVGDPATGNSRLLVGGVTDDHDPGFSPDGTLIAFLRSYDASSADLFTVRADGTDLKRMTTAPIDSIAWSIWTPDSRHVGVSHTVAGTGVLETFDLDGHVQTVATGYDVKSFQYRPPLGQQILFRADKDGVSGLFVMDASGANIHPVRMSTSPGNDLDLGATYNADGSRIFFQSAVQVSPDNGCCQLWVMDADGLNAHQFPDDRVINAWEGVPVVSPDGRWVAFWRVTGTGQHASVVRADGTGPVIPAGPILNGMVNFWWSPDSTKLIVTPQEDVDVARQYIADPATGKWTTSEWATRTLDQQRLAP